MLKMNYKGDVYTGSRKYTQTANGDGTISLSDSTVYTQQGDNFDGADINATNAEIMGFTNDVVVFDDANYTTTTTDSSGKKTVIVGNAAGTEYTETLYDTDGTTVLATNTITVSDIGITEVSTITA